MLEVWAVISDEIPTGTCYGRMRQDAEASCKWVLDHMPTDSELKTKFGPRTDPYAEVALPWVIESRQYFVT